jgi:hypothetical protein
MFSPILPALESIFRSLLVLSSLELFPVDQHDLLSFGEMKLILREWLARDEHHDWDASYQMELTGKVTGSRIAARILQGKQDAGFEPGDRGEQQSEA